MFLWTLWIISILLKFFVVPKQWDELTKYQKVREREKRLQISCSFTSPHKCKSSIWILGKIYHFYYFTIVVFIWNSYMNLVINYYFILTNQLCKKMDFIKSSFHLNILSSLLEQWSREWLSWTVSCLIILRKKKVT